MKKIIALLLVAATLLGILCSCGDDEEKEVLEPGQGSSISYSLTADPKNIDPQSTNDNNSLMIVKNVFEGLVRMDEYGNAKPGVALSWTHNDTCTQFSFTLRQDAKWSDGTPVTAKDFVFGWRRAVMPETQSVNASKMFCVKNAQNINLGGADPSILGIIAPDDYTINVELEYSFADFPIHTTQSVFMPCSETFFYTTKGKYGLDDETLLTNGPFKLTEKSWVHDEYLRIYYNEFYRGEVIVYPRSIYFGVRRSSVDYYDLISVGTVDAAKIPAAQATDALNSGMTCISYADTTWGLVFNTSTGVLSNLQVRQAFARAIDTKAYEPYIPQYTEVAYDIIPPATRYNGKIYRELAGNGYKVKYDPEEAKKSYQAGLITLGRLDLPKITVLIPDDKNAKVLMQSIIQCWINSISTYVNLSVLPLSEIKDKVQLGDFQIAFYPLSPVRDGPITCLNMFRSDTYSNPAKYADSAYDLLLNKTSMNISTDEAVTAFVAAEKYLNEQAAFYPLFYESQYYLTNDKVSGIIFEPFGGIVDFTKARKDG